MSQGAVFSEWVGVGGCLIYGMLCVNSFPHLRGLSRWVHCTSEFGGHLIPVLGGGALYSVWHHKVIPAHVNASVVNRLPCVRDTQYT